MLARVHVEEKICKRTLEPRSPAFVNGEARAGDLCGRRQIQNARAFADFPVGLWREIEFGRRAPAADFHVVRGARADRHGGVRNIGNGKQQFALRGIQCGDALVGLLDELGDLLHFRDQRVGVLLFFLEACNLVAGFVALRLALLVGGDQLATLLVERAKSIQIERGMSALLRHFGEDVEVVSEIVEVMHGGRRIP